MPPTHPTRRTILGSSDTETLRACLHPAEGPTSPAWTAVAAPGFVVRVTADPALARAMPAIVARLEAAGALASLAPPDRAEATALRAWSLASVGAMRSALLPLGEACARARVRAFLCKGAALHGLLYPDSSSRPAADADLFVPSRDVARFVALLPDLGFEPSADAEARVEAFVRTGARRAWLVDLGYGAPAGDFVVEVKADPVGIGLPPRRLDALAEGGTPSPVYPGLLVPSAETMALQQAFSLARRPSPDLLAHAELAGVLWARRHEIRPERVFDLVQGEGLTGILRGVFEETDRAFPGVVPPTLLRRRGRPAGYTPPRIRRGTLAGQPRETGWTRLSFWGAQAVGGRPLATIAWMLDRLFPPQPLLAMLTGGRHGLSATGTRLVRLALA